MAKNAGFNETEQHEIAQRVGIVLVEKADEYDPSKGTHRMWAAGIARNILLDARRAARTERRRTDRSGALKHIPSPTLTPEETLRARESLVLLREGVRPENRSVFDLDAQGCTGAEIAEALGMSPAQVDWRLREARKDLDRTLVTLGEDRKEITRVRSGVFLPFVFQGLSGAGSAPDTAEPLSPPAAEARVRPPEVVSKVRDARSGSWRFWAGVQSTPALAMAAALVLVLGSLVGLASGVEEAPPAVRLTASADSGPASSEPSTEVACSGDGGAPVSAGLRPPVATTPSGLRPPMGVAVSARRGRQREWLVIKTLLGLRRDAESQRRDWPPHVRSISP